MYYIKTDENGIITQWTNDEEVAARNNLTEISEIEPVMQGDGSGYVLKSNFKKAIDNVIEIKREELKEIRYKLETEPITTPYGVFDYDPQSRERITAAIFALEVAGEKAAISWTLADNTECTVTANILKNIIAIIAQRSNLVHIQYRKYSSTLDDIKDEYMTNAISYEEAVNKISAVNWDYI